MTDTPQRVPQRVTVSSPRMMAARVARHPVTREIDELTGLGEVYMRSLMRAQGRLAFVTAAAVVLGLGALPILFAVVPAVREASIAGIPIVWLILGVGVYPWLLVVGAVFVRQAERNERRFTDLVAPQEPPE